MTERMRGQNGLGDPRLIAPARGPVRGRRATTERLRDLRGIDDLALAELAQLVRASSDLDPPLGAQERVRRALHEPRSYRRRPGPFALAAVLVVGGLLLVAVLPAAIAGVRKLVALAPAPPAPVVESAVEDAKPAPARRRTALRVHRPNPPDDIPPDPMPEETADEPVVAETPAAPAPAPAAGLPPAPVAGPPPAPRASPPPAPRAGPPPAPRAGPPVAPSEPRAPTAGPTPAAPAGSPAPSAPGAPRGPRVPAGSRAPDGPPAPITGLTPCAPCLPPAPAEGPASPPPTPSPTPSAEAGLVISALRLLRHDHDARTALRLLEAYRSQFPYGDLNEEALALSVEAHVALGDPEAAVLADQYRRQFPQGRFRDVVDRARRPAGAR